MNKTVRCPTCGKKTEYSPDNRYRPFCSERCRILDLGAWAEEKYRVPDTRDENHPVNENSQDLDALEGKIPPRHELN